MAGSGVLTEFRATAREGLKRFLRHFAEMVIAMFAGMLLFSPVWEAVAGAVGAGDAYGRVDVEALLMATSMTLGMTVWMRYRGHGWAATAEMGAAMYVPFLLVLLPYWAGLVPGATVTHVGHMLMLPAMVLAMLWRRDEYTHAHPVRTDRVARRGIVGALTDRWPTWLALLMSLDNWIDPVVPAPWVMVVLPGGYLLIGAFRGTLKGPKVLATQLAAAAGYLALILVAVSVDATTAAYLVAFGWIAHALWDLGHHIADRVVPRAYAEWCGVLDLVIGVTILLLVL